MCAFDLNFILKPKLTKAKIFLIYFRSSVFNSNLRMVQPAWEGQSQALIAVFQCFPAGQSNGTVRFLIRRFKENVWNLHLMPLWHLKKVVQVNPGKNVGKGRSGTGQRGSGVPGRDVVWAFAAANKTKTSSNFNIFLETLKGDWSDCLLQLRAFKWNFRQFSSMLLGMFTRCQPTINMLRSNDSNFVRTFLLTKFEEIMSIIVGTLIWNIDGRVVIVE